MPARTIRGALALLSLLAAMLGIPALLITLIGNPIADVLPQLALAVTVPELAITVIIRTLLPCLAWLLWAYLMLCLLQEAYVTAQLPRRRTQRTAPSRDPFRRFATWAISAIVALLAGLGAVAPAHAAAPTTPSSETQEFASTLPAAATVAAPATSAEHARSVVVREGDSLWSIAERLLGDGHRYRQLAERNLGRPQADGGALGDDLWLVPGWVLELPGGEDDEPASAESLTVEPGDTLWQIAEEYLGDGHGYQLLAAANGIVDPDELRSGMTLQLPDGAAPDPPAGTAVAYEARSAVTDRSASGFVPPNGASDGDGLDTGASSDPPTSAAPDHLELRTAGGIGAVLASGVLGWLATRRLLQRRGRRPGTRIAMPDLNEAVVEQELRAATGENAEHRIDLVLRSLAIWAQDERRELPALQALRLAGETVELQLAEPASLPAPFRSSGTRRSEWAVRSDALPPLERIPSAPYPALVSLGIDEHGAAVCIDLEQLGVLELTGDDSAVLSTLRSLVLELATSVWAEHVVVTLVGWPQESLEQLGAGRLRQVDDAERLVVQLESQLQHAERTLQALGSSSPLAARSSGGDEAEAWPPEILILGGLLDPGPRRRLIELARSAPRLGLAVVGRPGTGIGDDPQERNWRFEFGAGETAELSSPGQEFRTVLRPNRLSRTEYDRILELAEITCQPPQTPTPSTGDWSISILPEGLPAEDECAPLRDDGGAAVAGWTAAAPVDPDARTTTTTRDTAGPGPADGFPPIPASRVSGSGPLTQGGTVSRRRPEDSRLRRRREGSSAIELDEAARTLLDGLGSRPWIRLLGPVLLLNPAGTPPITPQTGEVNNSAVNRATELAAYLALHPGATAVQLHSAFWPGRDPHGKTAAANRNGLTTRTRKWLGNRDDGEPYFPHVAGRGYRLHADVTTDWQVFRALLGPDLRACGQARLLAALDLVRGQPFAGTKERFYGWAEVTRMEMLALIGDACHELTARSLHGGDAGTARVSAALGREIDPVNETAWRDALNAELLAGDHDGFERLVQQLQSQLDDFEDGYEPEPETQELIDRARANRQAAHPHPVVAGRRE